MTVMAGTAGEASRDEAISFRVLPGLFWLYSTGVASSLRSS